MVCSIIGVVTAILLPYNELVMIEKFECWHKVKEHRNKAEYQIIEGFKNVNVVYYDDTSDTYYVTYTK